MNDEWYPTLEEALQRVPVQIPCQSSEIELESVEVIDGSTGEKIAWGQLSYPVGYWRGSGYLYSEWGGYRPDTGTFSVVYSGRFDEIIDRTWAEILQEMQEKQRQKDLEKAKQDLADAQRRLQQLSKP